MSEPRESTIIYRSFFECTKSLNNDSKAQLWDAICELAFNNTEIALNGIEASLFTLIKPNIEANNKRYANGCKGKDYGKLGGRPKTPKKPQKNPKLTPNLTPNKDKDKDKDKDNNVNKDIKEKEQKEILLLFSDIEQKAIQKWLDYKKEKKQLYKQTGLNTLLDKMKEEKLRGCDIAGVINISILNNWQGLFFDKGYSKNSIANTLKNCNDQDFSIEEI